MTEQPALRPLGPEIDHYWLALRMSRTVGVDLQQAIDSGSFSQQAWADTVTRCRGCAWGADCPSWLDAHDRVDSAPQTCVNAGLFDSLKAQAPD